MGNKDMGDDASASKTPLEPPSLFEDISEVMRRAQLGVREALRDHQIAGNTVAVWRDGAVVLVDATDNVVADDPQETPDKFAEQKT